MRNTYMLIIFSLLLSCSNEEPKSESVQKLTTEELVMITQVNNTQINTTNPSDFPNCDYSRIILFELVGNGNHQGAESVFYQQTGNFIELTQNEIQEFLSIIKDTSSFNQNTAACHEPRIGLVFYNENNTPCSYLSLCLECNNIYSNPSIEKSEHHLGFSIESRSKIREFLYKWNFPDDRYSFFFDDIESFKKSLVMMEIDSLEIEHRIKMYQENALVE